MDLSILQSLTPNLAAFFHLAPETLLAWILVLCTVANIIGRIIPDDATGVLGAVRDVCKALGLYVANRVSSGVTVNDVAKSIVQPADKTIEDLASQSGTLIPDVVDQVVAPFPGLQPRGPDGKFVKSSDIDTSKALSPWIVGIIAVVLALTLNGCAAFLGGLNKVGTTICSHEAETRLALEAAKLRAFEIEDPAQRATAIKSIQLSLNALDSCHASG